MVSADLEKVSELRRRSVGGEIQADAALDDADTMRYAMLEFEKHVQRARAQLCAANDNNAWGTESRLAMLDLLATLESQLYVSRQESYALRRAYSLMSTSLYCAREVLSIQDIELSKLRDPH